MSWKFALLCVVQMILYMYFTYVYVLVLRLKCYIFAINVHYSIIAYCFVVTVGWAGAGIYECMEVVAI